MRALIQRVARAHVAVENHRIAEIGPGLLVFVAVCASDREADADWLAAKVCSLRVFEDEEGRFDRSVAEVSGEILIVSQFTLYADTRKGRRPSFAKAAKPQRAEPLYERLIAAVRHTGIAVQVGRFGARMQVHLVNDGPVTIMIDSPEHPASHAAGPWAS